MKKRPLKSIAVWQPYFAGGGAEAVSLWILEALQNDYAVTLHTLTPIELSWLNTMYNTRLSSERVQIKSYLPTQASQIAAKLLSFGGVFRMSLIYFSIKKFKQFSKHYDVVFSTFNGVDMGQVGIQYLHWVRVVEKKPEKAPYWFQQLMRWVDFSHERLKLNQSIANSHFTATKVRQVYGIDSQVIYPPVVNRVVARPWHEKENAFLCSGRLVRAKSPHRVIQILKAVRDRGFDIQLHLTGGGGGTYERSYQNELKKLVKQNSEWIFLHQDLPYDDYLEIVARCRYGLHVKPEPFGISVAEMLKADLLPFVRSKGGQVEIVGTENQELLFENDDDAIAKIIQVLQDEDLRSRLSHSLQQRKELFSAEKFMVEIKAFTHEFIQERSVAQSPLLDEMVESN